ncbi:hypothetical protein GMOD_00003469 [Pyrenophora seminiperda CCB06]|uniref:Uncharacterized protein n=1 Tax=Pyrenophora seminiperda CCB06 TaxID=1302712 RepID=A0A3M7MJ29_9PLEO|nr:hypothetical protein GMOD_00003469 [Pyrenophora seminiperda CCB06]
MASKNTEELSRETTLRQIYRTIENAMSHKTLAKDSATKTASLISKDPKVWFDVVGIDVSLAVRLQDDEALRALVDYLVELASLPDAINESDETVVVENIGYGGASVCIEPGEPLVMGDGGAKLWRDLPDWSMVMTESFQGPELWLHDNHSPENSELAKTKWRNLNTYLALRATHARAQNIPVLANGIRLARVTLMMALEHSPESRLGKNVNLHIPAAAEWFRIAGDEIERLCKNQAETMSPGDLWARLGGGEMCDSARLSFWKKRMSELGYTEVGKRM